MSYDLRVWGRESRQLADILTTIRGWKEVHDGWTLQKSTWQIVIMRPVRAEPEDVPEHASDVMPGLSMLVEMSLEPSSAPNAAYSVLLSTSRELAAAVDGLVEDPQEGSVTPAVGRKRFAKPRQEERFAKVQLSWWYTASPLRTPGGASELLRLVATHVPEAVPHRYGFFAPLPHHTAESGHDALAGFLHENLDRFARYDCKRPAVHFNVSDCDFKADDRLGFRTNLFSIGMEHQALREPSREHAVRRLWRELSAFFRPFYGEARVLSGYLRRGASDMETEVHPVRSGFWRGVPRTPGLAMVLGPPYAELWPLDGAERVGELVFLEQAEWGSGQRLDTRVPADLVQRWEPGWKETVQGGYVMNWCDEFPPNWPFGPNPSASAVG